MRILFFALCAVSMLFSCKREKGGESPFVEVAISTDDQSGQAAEYFGSIDSIFVLDLKIDEKFLLGDIAGVRFANDRIYVLSGSKNTKLFVFDTDGNPITQIGRQGRGPGEYMEITNFFVTPQQVFLFDDSYSCIFVYDAAGAFLHKWDTDAIDAGLVDDQTVAEYDGAGNIALKDLQGNELRTLTLDVKGIEEIDTSCFSYFGRQLVFTDVINQNTYFVTPDELVPNTHIHLGEWQIPENYYRQFKGEAPNNLYINVVNTITLGPEEYGRLVAYDDGLTWEFYTLIHKPFPRRIYRHKESGRTLLLPVALWEEDYDAGFKSLGIGAGGVTGTYNDFFVISVEPGEAIEFVENGEVENPMLLRLQERMRGMGLSEDGNPLLLFYRLK